jgi:hypothetical protein
MPPATKTSATSATQASIARAPAAVMAGDVGAFSSSVVAIGQPERKPDSSIHPAITRQ